MKNKIVKIILIIIMIFSVISIHSNAENKIEAKKGDLRCPPNNNGKCVEEKDAFGNVKSVTITETTIIRGQTATIQKIVSKKENSLSNFDVQFKIKGTNNKVKKANIYFLLDASSTIGTRYLGNSENSNSIANAVNKFTKGGYFDKTIDTKNIKYGFATFYGLGILASRDFSKKVITRDLLGDNCKNRDKKSGNCLCPIDLNENKECSVSKYHQGSPIQVGLQKAFEDLNCENKACDGVSKYLIIMGDGNYSEEEIEGSKLILENIKKIDRKIKIYFIGYHLSTKNVYDYYKPDGTKYIGQEVIEDFIKSYYGNVNPTNYYVSGDLKDIISLFKHIAEKIGSEIKPISAEINDNLGEYFTKTESLSFSFEDIGTEQTTEKVTISIKNDAPTGWHTTNGKKDSIKSTGYTVDFGDDITFESKINPQVYWEKEKGWESCTDYASSSTTITNYDEYYDMICSQQDISSKEKGFYAYITTNNLSINKKTFNLPFLNGFPIEINVQSNVKCIYKVKIDDLKNNIKNLVNKYNSTTGKQKTETGKEIEKIIKKIKNIANNKSSILEDYKTKFDNLTANLLINYEDKNISSTEWPFQVKSLKDNEVKCNIIGEEKIKINNKYYTVPTEKKCSLSSKKTLILEESCLSMTGGGIKKCSTTSKNLIDGGNMFYPNENAKVGYVSVIMKNATFSGSNIILTGDKKSNNKDYDCKFTMDDIKQPIYRQIELADPFNKSYNTKRKVGNNWLNTEKKYNFIKIINDKVWDGNFEYQYQISKKDIEKIKNNTSSKGVNSYLGVGCNFNSKNKYICPFVRPEEGKNGKSKYFTNINVS